MLIRLSNEPKRKKKEPRQALSTKSIVSFMVCRREIIPQILCMYHHHYSCRSLHHHSNKETRYLFIYVFRSSFFEFLNSIQNKSIDKKFYSYFVSFSFWENKREMTGSHCSFPFCQWQTTICVYKYFWFFHALFMS